MSKLFTISWLNIKTQTKTGSWSEMCFFFHTDSWWCSKELCPINTLLIYPLMEDFHRDSIKDSIESKRNRALGDLVPMTDGVILKTTLWVIRLKTTLWSNWRALKPAPLAYFRPPGEMGIHVWSFCTHFKVYWHSLLRFCLTFCIPANRNFQNSKKK